MPPDPDTVSPAFNVRTLLLPLAIKDTVPVPAVTLLLAANVMLPVFVTLIPVPVSLIALAPDPVKVSVAALFNKLILPLVELLALKLVTAFATVFNDVPVAELVVSKPPVTTPLAFCVIAVDVVRLTAPVPALTTWLTARLPLLFATVITPLPADVLIPTTPFTVLMVSAVLAVLSVKLNAFVVPPLMIAANVVTLLLLAVTGLIETDPDVLILKLVAVKPVVLFCIIAPVPLTKFNIDAGDETAADIVIVPASLD